MNLGFESDTSISDILIEVAQSDLQTTHWMLPQMLRAIRSHLEMDVSFISEFLGSERVFRYVDSPWADQPIQVGGVGPLKESYCQRVVDGRLPKLIPDTSVCPAALELPVTTALPVGAHISVPLVLQDGRTYGTLCCFSFQPNNSLCQRDLAVMQAFADIASDLISREFAAKKQAVQRRERIESVLNSDSISIVYQPIYSLKKDRSLKEDKVVGFESLARFSVEPIQSPDIWFNEAAQVDLDVQLEIKAVKLALAGFKHLPEDCYISVNLSPKSLLTGDIQSEFKGYPLNRIVVEVTEHSIIDCYEDIVNKLAPLLQTGLRLSVDDVGAGYASFRHILSLDPDIIKLDISIIRDIDTDFRRRALAIGLIAFAEATQTKIIAEGIETEAEYSTLKRLGANQAQGYFLARPMTPTQLEANGWWCRQDSKLAAS